MLLSIVAGGLWLPGTAAREGTRMLFPKMPFTPRTPITTDSAAAAMDWDSTQQRWRRRLMTLCLPERLQILRVIRNTQPTPASMADAASTAGIHQPTVSVYIDLFIVPVLYCLKKHITLKVRRIKGNGF